jgi:hypothetical protein
MRVAFLQKDPLPDPALMALGASLAFRGHEAEVFLPAAERDLQRSIRRFAPALVVLRPPTGLQDWAIEQARAAKACTGGAPTVLVGQYAIDHPEVVRQDGVDLVVLGDPETTIPELLWKIFKERELPGTSGTVACVDGELVRGGERAFVDDVDQLPLPDLEIYRRYGFVGGQTTLPFAVGRGPLENTHAGARVGAAELRRRFGPARRHSVAEATQRLNLLIARRPSFRRVAFRDDTLLHEPRSGWLDEFLARYRAEIGKPFSCVARPDQLDAETVSRLAEAGCDRVLVVIGAGTEELRAAAMGVELPDALVEAAVGRVRDAGMRVWTQIFLGHRGETEETAQAAVDLVARLKPDHAFAHRVLDGEGDAFDGLDKLCALLPVGVGLPLGGVLTKAAPGLLAGPLHQLHHDLSMFRSDELATRDVLRVAAGLWRGRSTRPARPMLE